MNTNESSYNDLYKSAVEAFPNTTKRQHATQTIEIKGVRWTPFIGMKTLFLKAEARNEDRHYNPIILFKNIDYSKKDVKLESTDGPVVHMEHLSLENHDISVRCNCNDFKWRFNYYNHLDKSLYGRKRAKYEGSQFQANPKEMPGMCKHLMKLMEEVENSGILKSK